MLKRLLAVLTLLVIAAIVYEVADTIYLSQSTGTLVANSAGAFLTVEQEGTKLVNIGTSHATVRLKPGNYLLVASKGHSQVNVPFVIVGKHTTTENVNVSQAQNPDQSVSAVESNKLITFLPFIGPNFDYKVSYKYNITSQAALPVIVITAPNESYRQEALNWITAVGFNPALLNIEYDNASPVPKVNGAR